MTDDVRLLVAVGALVLIGIAAACMVLDTRAYRRTLAVLEAKVRDADAITAEAFALVDTKPHSVPAAGERS